MIRLLISGVNGKMGRMLCACVEQTSDMRIVAGVDVLPDAVKNDFSVYGDFSSVTEQADVAVDFSRPGALRGLLEYARTNKTGAVLATTGYSADDKEMIGQYAERVPLFYSANMSLGVNLQIMLAGQAAEILGGAFDIEIVEKHHRQKADSPSGTALSIADRLNAAPGGGHDPVFGRHSKTQKRAAGEIGIHAVRGGTVVGEHDVLFFGQDEVLEINHRAHSRRVFAEGAIHAARFLHGKPAALYSMTDIFREVFDR